MDKRLRLSELQQNLVTEYDENMQKSLDQHHRLDADRFNQVETLHRDSILEAFAHDQDTDHITLQILKQQLQLLRIKYQKLNDEKPTVSATATGAVVGSVTGITAATGGAVGASIVTSSLAVSIATGGFVLVGVAAVALGVGVGFGVKKLVEKLQTNLDYDKPAESEKDEKKKLI